MNKRGFANGIWPVMIELPSINQRYLPKLLHECPNTE